MFHRKTVEREWADEELTAKARRHLQVEYTINALPEPLRRAWRAAEPYVRVTLGRRVPGQPRAYRLARIWLDRRDLRAGHRPLPVQERSGRAERWLLRS